MSPEEIKAWREQAEEFERYVESLPYYGSNIKTPKETKRKKTKSYTRRVRLSDGTILEETFKETGEF